MAVWLSGCVTVLQLINHAQCNLQTTDLMMTNCFRLIILFSVALMLRLVGLRSYSIQTVAYRNNISCKFAVSVYLFILDTDSGVQEQYFV